MSASSKPRLGHAGTGEAELQAGGELERRLSSIEVELKTLREVPQQLKTLREVPQQLGTILDALEKLQAHFEPPVPPNYCGGPVPGVEQEASGQGHPRPQPPAATERSAKQEEAQRALRKMETRTSLSSADRSPTLTRPLIGQPAPPAEPSKGLPGVRQRRPSTQSDDPRAMEISRQRRIPGLDDILEAGVLSSHTAMGPLSSPSTSRKSAPRIQQAKKASTCGDFASLQSAGPDPVMPSCMPEELDPDVETWASLSSPKQSMVRADSDATVHTLLEGGNHVAAVCVKHRDSVKSNLSLGGDGRRRESINSSHEGAMLILARDDEGLGIEKWVLHPSSCVRATWDLCMVLLTLVVGTVVSVALCYRGDDLLTDFSYVVFLNVVSGVWWLDIGLSFWTGFYRGGKVVHSLRSVAVRYLRSWLVPDLLSALPLMTSSIAAARALSGLKLVRVVRLGPLLAGRQQDHRLLGLPARVSVMVLVTTVGMTCLWRLTLQADEARGAEAADAGVDWGDLFVTDMYWVAMTMSTVGFGDVTPLGTVSRLFAILAMLVAPIFFGTIVSLLTHVTQSIFNDELEVQVAEANSFMRQRGLPLQLRSRVERNLRYQIRQERLTLRPALFGKLSTAVQREISLELLSSSVLNFPLFGGVPHSFIAEIAQAHTWVQCLTGDLVVEEGQLIQEVVFIIRGRMRMHGRLENTEMDIIDEGGEEASRSSPEFELGAGAWFSEAALFFSDRMRTVTVYAAADSELAVLLSNDYHRIVQKYPRLLQRHRGIAKSLEQGQLSLRDLAYRRSMEPLDTRATWRVPRSPWDWLLRSFSGPPGSC